MFLFRLALELHVPVSVIERLPAREIHEWRAYFSILNEPKKQKPAFASPEAEMLAWQKHLGL